MVIIVHINQDTKKLADAWHTFSLSEFAQLLKELAEKLTGKIGTSTEEIKVVGHGKVTCEAYSPYVRAPFASGPYFEAVLNNSDGD